MAGVYIHIPFCKQKCSYCDFHFSTSLKNKSDLLKGLIKEIKSKKTLLNEPIQSIYFGGGTPSILNNDELSLIIETLYINYAIEDNVEFTLECNPDDLTHQKIVELKKAGINRLSIGVQSFLDEDLHFFNRAHKANEAETSILMSQDAGFENITIDLIYGSPLLTMKKWEQNLEKVRILNVPHLSAYSLTVEPKTELFHQVKIGKVQPLLDDDVIDQFKMLMQKTEEYGLTQYEISNFGKEGFYSKHNSNYWKGVDYLGFGPSAHSYINGNRHWNVSNNLKYINAINDQVSYSEEELIDENTAYNEYILTRLRTVWGIELEYLKKQFNQTLNAHFNQELKQYLNSSYLHHDNKNIKLTKEGIFIADKITSDLFYIE